MGEIYSILGTRGTREIRGAQAFGCCSSVLFAFVVSGCGHDMTAESADRLDRTALTIKVEGGAASIWLESTSDPMTRRRPHAEITPSVLAGGWVTQFIATDQSFMCSFPWENNPLLASGNVPFDFRGTRSWCNPMLSPSRNLSTSIYDTPAQWRRNYAGIFGAFTATNKAGRTILYTVNHGENKNEALASHVFQNTINGGVQARPGPDGCFSGPQHGGKLKPNNGSWYGASYDVNGPYRECYDAYNAFVYLDAYYFDSVNGYGTKLYAEFGPVLWPRPGYLDYGNGNVGAKASSGVRHPSVYVDENFVYLFYVDQAAPGASGSGIKVARAPIREPTKFRVFYQGHFSEPGMPVDMEDFSAIDRATQTARFRTALTRQGPRGDSIFPEGTNITRAAVARLADMGGYIAVLTMIDWVTGRPSVAIALSSDLTSWPVEHIQTVWGSARWDEFGLLYALPMSNDGTSNVVVHAAGFYIIGVDSAGVIHRIPISISISIH